METSNGSRKHSAWHQLEGQHAQGRSTNPPHSSGESGARGGFNPEMLQDVGFLIGI